jgi:hypothetical protein
VLVRGLLPDHLERCFALWPVFSMREKRVKNGWISLALEPTK